MQMRSLDDMTTMFDLLTDLSDQQRSTIKSRYRFLMSEYRRRCQLYTILFYLLRTTITVGSLAVPGLLSLTVPPESQDMLRWLTWSISLAVTTANGLVTLFKVDKRFFLMHSVAEHLRTETWQYLSLAGHYSGHKGGFKPTHVNQYVFYTTRLERIRMNHIEDEYQKQAESAQEKEADKPVSGTPVIPASSVPSPANTKNLQTPAPRRRDSESTIGSNDEVSVSSSGGSAMPAGGGARQSILPAASGVPALTIVEVGAPVSAGLVQPESARAGNP
jgi:hypothetical protein